MNKDLIMLQRGCNATCVVVLEDSCNKLEPNIVMDACIRDEFLFASPIGTPIFKERLEEISNSSDIAYFIIKGIDEVTVDMQNRYVSLVKDREFLGYSLPQNVIIVFTVKDSAGLKKITPLLYHFCVVAF